MQRILSNPFYYGIFKWGGETYEGTHKSLITKKLFYQCQAIMEQRGRETRRHIPTQYPYRQLLKCDYCACFITSSIAKGKYIYYHCGKRRGKCPGKYITQEAIDEQVRSALQKVSLTPADALKLEEELRKLHEMRNQAGVSRTEILRSTLRSCSEKLYPLLDMSLSGEITRDEYVIKKNKLIEEKTDIEQKLRSISDGGDSWFEYALAVIQQATAIPNALQSPDPADRADFFKKVGLNRTLRAEKIVFQPRNGWKAIYDAPKRRVSKKSHTSDSEYDPLVLLGSAGRIRTCNLPV